MTQFITFRLSNFFKFPYRSLILSFLLFAVLPLAAQPGPEQKGEVMRYEVSYLHDFVSNVTGGLQKGNEHLGMLNLRLKLNPDYVSLWTGGSIYIHAAMTQGGRPARTLTGDFHGLSNIEAGEMIYMHELWYQHRLGSTIITAGLQDLNKEFLVIENGGRLMNSTFGIPTPLAGLATMPIFPHTTLGLTLQHKITDEFYLQTALYDGRPDDFENNNFNLNWNLSRDDGFTSVSELHYRSDKLTGKETLIKGGVFYHSSNDRGSVNTPLTKTASVYILADQQIYDDTEGPAMGVFLQAAADAGLSDERFVYFGTGFSLRGLLRSRPDDVISFGYAGSLIGHDSRVKESIFELSFRVYIKKEQLFIQPDIQYIINPCGSGSKLNNALVFLLRAGMMIH